MPDFFNLKGKRILVTGASSGIGRETAYQLSLQGASLILLGRNEVELQQTLETLEGEGHALSVFDLSEVDLIPKKMQEFSGTFGRLNGLFHSAGVECIQPLILVKEKMIDEVFATSIKSALLLAKGFCQRQVKSGEGMCSVVFMSSVAGSVGQRGLSVYSASKAAIDGVVRSLANELADKDVRVNSIVAGAIKTKMHDRLVKNLNDESISDYENMHVLGFGEAVDVAKAAVFLLSDASKWITGTSMVVDGGFLSH